ncbi:hypothetical protein ACVCNR_23735 [Aquamicrobium terrae]
MECLIRGILGAGLKFHIGSDSGVKYIAMRCKDRIVIFFRHSSAGKRFAFRAGAAPEDTAGHRLPAQLSRQFPTAPAAT